MSEAVRLPHPGVMEPRAVEAAVLTEVSDAVRLKSCSSVDLGLSHVSSPVFLVAPPVSYHVDLGARLPSARDELEIGCAEKECLSVPAHIVSLL